MQPHEATLDTAVWEDGNAVSIDYSIDVMQDLRRLSVDGFNAFGHGGKEIGGVLYGRRGESGLGVLAYAELECEHALGPRFILSEKDHAALVVLLEPRDGLQAIGWFRAHTRSGLELDAKDLELFDRHFECPLSVGLVLKPTRLGPATAAFYLRGVGGEVNPHAVREFAIELPKRETAEEILTAAEILPVQLAPAEVALVVPKPDPPPAVFVRPAVKHAVPEPRRSWPWALCAGALLGAVITLAVESRPARPVHADIPVQSSPARDLPATAEAERAAPLPAALPAPQPAVATPAFLPPVSNGEIKPRQREVLVPRILPTVAASPASLPAPPSAGLDLAAAPKPLEFVLDPLLSVAAPPAVTAVPPPAVTPKRTPAVYAGPRQGRLIWTGDLARRGVIELDGSHVSPGSLTGALPGVPLVLRIMPAEFSRDGLTVFTSDPLRDNKTETASQSNGWNSLHFKLDAVRERQLTLLETPNSANDYRRLAVRNDGRQCFVVLMEWNVL